MISGTSTLIVRWLAPIMFLTSIFLSNFAFVGPVPTFPSISLLTVKPVNITQGAVISGRGFEYAEGAEGRRVPRAALAQVLAAKADGASIFIGPLGSCEKKNNKAKLVCQSPSWSPIYSFTSLPTNNAATYALPTSPSVSPSFYMTSLVFSLIFFLLSCAASLAEILPKAPPFLTKMNTSGGATRLIASIGILGFILGFSSSIVWRVSFGRDVDSFNARVAAANGNPALFAQISNGFTMMWIAFSFQAPLLVCQFFKLHMQTVASGKA